MFVSNFHVLMISNSHTPSNTDGGINLQYDILTRSGEIIHPGYRMYSTENQGYNSKLLQFEQVIFGTSDIPEGFQQYNIQGEQIEVENQTVSLNYGLNKNSSMVYVMVSGTALETKEVKEVAFIKKMNRVDTEFMIYRKVLDTPIQLSEGESYNFFIAVEIGFI